MIEHENGCNGQPCTCKGKGWDDTWGAANPSIGKPVACNCIHLDGVWMTRHSTQCAVHPCVACLMGAGAHIAHINIEGLSMLAEDNVEMRNCWACNAQQYKNREGEWTHVYPAAGCLRDADAREQNNEGAKK